ncbi:transcriptional regulator NrdR [Vulcanibacillus modesticaldus]|uniref:Transcriptional repressor NrdR n=1 Tax=Vulcanibacillus modesticaldus TaxID=337097 RepID=A0A1D2YSW7_9BACI|nr:transcriptional regulator NrdR [Vulcanibacillus modesticaldus]OEF98104.1 transcriptional regulator NrdR [Vulcanibacillus modesticaldus]
MRCPYCNYNGTRVLDSRPIKDGKSIRRRRECDSCNRRFNTYEEVEETPILVIKKDGSREEFSKEKILRGVIRACEKRPVPLDTLESMVSEIERELRNQLKSEVDSQTIGEMVMERLYHIDEISYVRFASVYRQFKDINVFIKEISELFRKS